MPLDLMVLGEFFFQTYWSIIQDDVFNSIWEFFKSGQMVPNYNANTIILIPKSSEDDYMYKFGL